MTRIHRLCRESKLPIFLQLQLAAAAAAPACLEVLFSLGADTIPPPPPFSSRLLLQAAAAAEYSPIWFLNYFLKHPWISSRRVQAAAAAAAALRSLKLSLLLVL